MASMYPLCPNGHPAESPTSRFCAICGSPISAPAPQMPPAPPPPASTCPNGHPLARPNQAFCEICAAPIGTPAPTMGAAPAAGYPAEAVPSPTYAPPPVAPPAYEPAPIPVGGGSRNVLALAIGGIAVFAAAALVAFVVMSPRGGAGPTPAPTSVAATASTPSSTAPAATPTMSPVTPTPMPTQAATPSPTPEPIVTAEPPAGSTCRGAAYGVTVTYPATWYAYAGDAERACTLFDPKPFTASGANAQVLGAVTIFSAPDSMDKTVADYAAFAGKVLQKSTATIDGRNATMLEIDEAGVGVAPDGMREYLYVIEYGTQSLIVVTEGIADPSYATTDWPYEGYQDNLPTVDFIAQSLTFD